MKGTMADYYTNFSLILPLIDVAQKQYALNLSQTAQHCRFEESELPPDFPESLKDHLEDWVFELKDQDEGIWVHSDSGGIDAVCAFIQHLLQRFQLTYRVSFEWSHDCSKPRTDAFGGGAAVISAKEIKTLTTSEWLQEQTRHVFSPQTDRCIYCNISAEDDLLENQPCGH